MKIAIATKNDHKIKELARLINIDGIEFISLRDLGFEGEIVEDGSTFAENALIKARFISQKYGVFAIADDSGLCVDALDGEPGIYSARYASTDDANASDEANIAKLLDKLKSIPSGERSGRFVCSMAFAAPDGVSFAVDGICEGHITSECRGEGGFGYDPVFYCTKLCKTFGEASEDEKNGVSHRYHACVLLTEKLKEYFKID